MERYIGVDGVVRPMNNADIGRGGVTKHVVWICSGVDGVVRTLMNWADEVDHIELRPSRVRAFLLKENQYSLVGEDLATVQKYGSVTVGNNYIEVVCNTPSCIIDLYGYACVVFKDGHSTEINRLQGVKGENILKFSVGYTLSFSASGGYVTRFYGKYLYQTHVNGYASGNVDIEISQSSGWTEGWSEFWISTMMDESGYVSNRQTYNSVALNGKSIPLIVVNELK